MANIQTLPNIISYKEIQKAQTRIKGHAIRSPLLPLNIEWEGGKIYLKLENLQPIGCFKIRGASNAIRCMSEDSLKQGVYTASAGNFAQGLSYCTKKFGIPCHIFTPDHAPAAKLNAIKKLGGEVHQVTFDHWWDIMEKHEAEGMKGRFIHPVSDEMVIAGNGTIGIEIYEDLPEVDAVIVPYGGGGLSCGIASALKHLKPDCPVYASEVETAAPLAASLRAGKPTPCTYTPTFVDGIGSKGLLDEMWPMVRNLIKDSCVMSLKEIADAVRLLAEANHVITEGAGASSVAAALRGKAGRGNIVCVVSGGHINTSKLITILQGEVP